MYPHNLPMHLTRALSPRRVAAGVLVALTLVSAACSNDSGSRITGPALLPSPSNSQSAAPSLAPPHRPGGHKPAGHRRELAPRLWQVTRDFRMLRSGT